MPVVLVARPASTCTDAASALMALWTQAECELSFHGRLSMQPLNRRLLLIHCPVCAHSAMGSAPDPGLCMQDAALALVLQQLLQLPQEAAPSEPGDPAAPWHLELARRLWRQVVLDLSMISKYKRNHMQLGACCAGCTAMPAARTDEGSTASRANDEHCLHVRLMLLADKSTGRKTPLRLSSVHTSSLIAVWPGLHTFSPCRPIKQVQLPPWQG